MNNKLNLHVMQRSADIILGIPYDVQMYGLLLMAFAKELNVKCGDLAFSISDCHIYEYLYPVAKKMMVINYPDFKVLFFSPGVNKIKYNPDEYILKIKNYYKMYKCFDYSPNLQCIK